MTKEEVKEVMKEMECWSCDNHLNICDKHSSKESESNDVLIANGTEPKAKYITVHKGLIDTPTPPSKQPTPRESICKKCGKSWPPRQGTYIVPLEYKEELCGECNYQPTRLELIREKIRLSGVARMNGRDVKYILSKLDTAKEILEEIAHSLDGNYEEGWMANEVAAEALKLIKED